MIRIIFVGMFLLSEKYDRLIRLLLAKFVKINPMIIVIIHCNEKRDFGAIAFFSDLNSNNSGMDEWMIMNID